MTGWTVGPRGLVTKGEGHFGTASMREQGERVWACLLGSQSRSLSSPQLLHRRSRHDPVSPVGQSDCAGSVLDNTVLSRAVVLSSRYLGHNAGCTDDWVDTVSLGADRKAAHTSELDGLFMA